MSNQVKCESSPLNYHNNSCPICWNEICQENKTTTECAHIFCKDCLDKWLRSYNTCPLCRKILGLQVPVHTFNGLSISRNGDLIHRHYIPVFLGE